MNHVRVERTSEASKGDRPSASMWYSQSDSNGRHARYKLAALTGLSYGSMVKDGRLAGRQSRQTADKPLHR